jgi:hypothetical protein
LGESFRPEQTGTSFLLDHSSIKSPSILDSSDKFPHKKSHNVIDVLTFHSPWTFVVWLFIVEYMFLVVLLCMYM